MAAPVLVIDDSASVRQLTRMMLERAGYSVIEATDGEDAYEKLDGRPLGMILCDLAMPRMDGLSFLRLLRHHPRYRSTPLAHRRPRGRRAGLHPQARAPDRPGRHRAAPVPLRDPRT